MIKLAAFADTHIRNLKFNKEYRIIFNKIYEKLRNEKPDIIVHCGDLVHTKTQLSPEAFELSCDFLRSLADIARTYIILGNHDLLIRNPDRQDAITPVVKALNHPNLYLLKKAEEIEPLPGLVLNALTISDKENWKTISDKSKINIALYHGSVKGTITDTGYVMEHGDIDLETLVGFDFALLGDIHRTNQSIDLEGRARYPGSTVQQNFGETDDKGFLIWEIEDKNNFKVKHFAIKNPAPFITIDLTENGKIPKTVNPPENAQIRLSANNQISLNALKKAIEVAKTKFKAKSVTFINRNTNRISVEGLTNNLKQENLRETQTQEKLIKEYLKDFSPDSAVLNKVLDLNSKYNTVVEAEEEISRNVNWKLKSFKWNNLFNYGKNNSIDFEKLHGVVGIFGKNYSGKSSIVDGLIWSIFNSTSKNVRKNVDIINQNRSKAFGGVEFVIGNDTYKITRAAEKYVKKLHGEETTEAKTDLDFEFKEALADSVKSLNGIDRRETDKNIRKVLGTLEDFLLTSMASQLGSFNFIDEGSTKRKEILAKFLDLDFFDQKFKLAKEDAADLKGALKRLEERDFEYELNEVEVALNQNELTATDQRLKCTLLKGQISTLKSDVNKFEIEIAAAPETVIYDIDRLKKDKVDFEAGLKENKELSLNDQEKIKKLSLRLYDTEQQLLLVSLEELKKLKKQSDEDKDKNFKLLEKIKQTELKLKRLDQKKLLLIEVPCGDMFPKCKFIEDAHNSKALIPKVEEDLVQLNQKMYDLKSQEIDIADLNESLERYERTNSLVSELKIGIANVELEKKSKEVAALNLTRNIEITQEKIDQYYKNESWIKKLKILYKSKESFEKEIEKTTTELESCEKQILELVKEHGSCEQKKENIEKEKRELSVFREQYSAYDLFQRCMHSNGIAFDIIKKRLPVVNQEVSKILTNIVDFEIFFEDDGKKLDIYIRHPKYEKRPLESGSGAEKTIAAMAIRLALLKVSSLPISDIFILDEPATTLDENLMDGFTRILEMLKAEFKTVILISHIEALKDVVDVQIVIDKQDGFAKVIV